MLESHQIKKEPSNLLESSDYKCTCINTSYVESSNAKKRRQVLVNFGLNRKKVFTLHRKKDKLHEKFTSYVLSEPAFSELLKDSYVVFQEYNQKFGTWVDVEPKETLRDGAVLNAVFFPTDIERDESNPGSIRRKQKELEFIGQNSVKRRRRRPSEVIQIDLSEEEADANVKNPVENGDCREDELTQEPKEKKRKKHKKEPDLQNVKKEVPEIKDQRNDTQEQSNGELSNKPKDPAVQEGTEETIPVIETKLPAVKRQLLPTPHAEKSAGLNNGQSSRDHNFSARSEDDPYLWSIQSLEELCAKRSWPAPKYNIEQDDNYIPFCKVLVNSRIYFAYHKFYSHLKAAAANVALKFLSPNKSSSHFSSPRRGSYSPFHHSPQNSLARGKPKSSSNHKPHSFNYKQRGTSNFRRH